MPVKPQLNRWTWRLGDRITCWEILNAGEGEPGQKIVLPADFVPNAPSEAAVEAAKRLDRMEGITPGDPMPFRRWIEVEGVCERVLRFVVVTEAELTYRPVF